MREKEGREFSSTVNMYVQTSSSSSLLFRVWIDTTVLFPPHSHPHILTPSHPHREKKQGHRALMMAAQEGDEIIVDILVACVSWGGGRGRRE